MPIRAGHPGRRDERQRSVAVAAPRRAADPGCDGAGAPSHRPLPWRPVDGTRPGRARRPVAGARSRLAWDHICRATRSARHWFGDGELGPVFQWHEEAFELPAGAMRLASSDACTHQAFAIGPHLAMQFHVEVDADKLRRWSMLDSEAYQALQQRHATVHSGPTMRAGMAEHLAGQQALADRVYACWLAGVGGRRA